MQLVLQQRWQNDRVHRKCLKPAAYERMKKEKGPKCACIMHHSAFLHVVLQVNTARHKMFATDKCTVCGGGGGGGDKGEAAFSSTRRCL